MSEDKNKTRKRYLVIEKPVKDGPVRYEDCYKLLDISQLVEEGSRIRGIVADDGFGPVVADTFLDSLDIASYGYGSTDLWSRVGNLLEVTFVNKNQRDSFRRMLEDIIDREVEKRNAEIRIYLESSARNAGSCTEEQTVVQ